MAKSGRRPKSNKSNNTRPRGSSGRPPQRRTPAPPPKSHHPSGPISLRGVFGFISIFIGLILFLGFFDVKAIFIDIFAKVSKGLTGYGYYVTPFSFLVCGVILLMKKKRGETLRLICALILPYFVGTVAQLLFAKTQYEFGGDFLTLVNDFYNSGVRLETGGVLSGLTGLGSDMLFSIYVAIPLFIVLSLLCFMQVLQINPQELSSKYSEIAKEMAQAREEKKLYNYEEDRLSHELLEPINESPDGGRVVAKLGEVKKQKEYKDIDILSDFTIRPEKAEVRKKAPTISTFSPFAPSEPKSIDISLDDFEESGSISSFSIDDFDDDSVIDNPLFEEEIEETGSQNADIQVDIELDDFNPSFEQSGEAYEFPPLELLNKSSDFVDDSGDEIRQNAERLSNAINSFGVSAEIVGITRGPTITRFDMELDDGVKLSKITNLSNDIALALGVSSVRIAPITGVLSTVGIEVPNRSVSKVHLRDVLESDNFKNAEPKLSFALGKNVSGDCVVGDIAALPHLLIAGTTGSGKSVCINSLILSLFYKSTPEEVRLIMIDPKMVELGIYNEIPHLLVPVVTDPKKAAGALQWAVVEMMKRYSTFAEMGVRNLSAYNKQRLEEGLELMPRVVIVVDELADLMIYAAKEVEESICRVAQMGRAAGMHLVIATQRPSADVITGLMKANIPSRIAFAVSSGLESRIILDQMGAEKLIGMGDMLFSPLGVGKPERIQGVFVSDEERERVISFIKDRSQANYSEDISAQIEEAGKEKEDEKGSGAEFSEYDELLKDAAVVVIEAKQASVSMLQRRLKLGYSRAARIVDQLEDLGIVGGFEGSKPREVKMTMSEWLEFIGEENGSDDLIIEDEELNEDF